MSIVLNLRFQKLDKYKNSIFIANPKKEAEAFNKLSSYYTKLKDTIESYIPIYATTEYATIRFKPNNKFTFEENNIYTITFTVNKKANDEGKEFISCFLSNSKLLEKAVKIDRGEILQLD